jgi:hypothetical protein
MGEGESEVAGREPEREVGPPTNTAAAESAAEDAVSTVGTGSVLGIGCLIVVVLLIAIAIAFRWFGGSW